MHSHQLPLQMRRQLSDRHTRIRLEGIFDGDLDARLVEGDDAAVALEYGEGLALERVELDQAELAIKLFV